MRPFVLFVFGALTGVIGTVMVLTLLPPFASDNATEVALGNARVSLDARALSAGIEPRVTEAAQALAPDRVVEVTVSPAIHRDGTFALALSITVDGAPASVATFVCDPEIIDGSFRTVLVERRGDGLLAGELVRYALDEYIAELLSQASSGRPYRVVAIQTADARLSVDVSF